MVQEKLARWAMSKLSFACSTLWDRLSSWHQASSRHWPRSVLPIWTISDRTLQQQEAKLRFIRQLHFIVPTTATKYHLQLRQELQHRSPDSDATALRRWSLSTHPETLTAGGKLICVEPSPENSRSRRHPVDPGTRYEQTQDGFPYRRIGDLRMSFVQCDVAETLLSQEYNKNGSSTCWTRSMLWDLFLDRVSSETSYGHASISSSSLACSVGAWNSDLVGCTKLAVQRSP